MPLEQYTKLLVGVFPPRAASHLPGNAFHCPQRVPDAQSTFKTASNPRAFYQCTAQTEAGKAEYCPSVTAERK